VSIFVIVLYLAAVSFFQPYRAKRDNTLALAIYAVLAITLFCGLLLKVKDGYESTGKYEDGFTDTAVAMILVSSVIYIFATALVITVYDICRVMREPLLRYKESRRIVMLPPLAEHQKFDLFLSHAQDLGQDQVATIKAALEKLLPGVKIFLDVEALDDLHVLEDLVKSSAALLMFLTKGCLQRHFVRLEISAAVDGGVKMIAVQETDTRHGSVPIAEHQADCPDIARQRLFEENHKEIWWIRTLNFRQVSVRQIIQRMLVTDAVVLPELLIPGEFSTRDVRLPALRPVSESVDGTTDVHFWLPKVDSWCEEIASCLQEVLPGLAVKVADPGQLAHIHAKTHAVQARGGGIKRLRTVTRRYLAEVQAKQKKKKKITPNSKDNIRAHAQALLLPLNKSTLKNPLVLSDLWAALQVDLPVVLIHIQEEECDAAPFHTFFAQCPPHLKDAGLFDEIACAWFFGHPHVGVACKVVGMKLPGAVLLPYGETVKTVKRRGSIFGSKRMNEGLRTTRVVHPIDSTVRVKDADSSGAKSTAQKQNIGNTAPKLTAEPPIGGSKAESVLTAEQQAPNAVVPVDMGSRSSINEVEVDIISDDDDDL
jgi:hypothetical protein